MKLAYEDLILRSITVEDTDDILRWRNAENVKKYFIKQQEISREDHLNWMKNKVETGRVIQFMMMSKTAGCPIGTVYLQDIDRVNRKA